MTDDEWQDRLVGARMRVDREFHDRVSRSRFSRQQWGLVMTAVEFEIEGRGEEARLVADTSKLDHVLPELDRIEERTTGPAGPGDSGPGVVDSIRSALGIGGGVDPEVRQEAVELAQEYASELQAYLEREGRWESVREAGQPSPE